MNERAKELGALNTNFVNPCGMDTSEKDKDHLSTARDLALISKYAMTLPLFREIVKKPAIPYLQQISMMRKFSSPQPISFLSKIQI